MTRPSRTLPQLSSRLHDVIYAGARRVGVSRDGADAILRAAASGGSSNVVIPGLSDAPRVRLSGAKVVPCYVLSYAGDASSCCLGWDVSQQERTARFDFRDLSRYDPVFFYTYAPFVSSLPARLAINLLVSDIAWCGGTGDFIRALDLGGMLVSAADFDERGRMYSAAAKTGKLDFSRPEWFKEVHVLQGCRFPDSESNAAVADELRKFCPRDVTLEEPMRSLYHEAGQKQRFSAAPGRTLEDYIASLDWKTAGGASMSGYGALDITSGDVEAVTRLTKAILPFVATEEELVVAVSELANCPDVLVKAVIKLGETSKNRIIFPYGVAPTVAKSYLLSHIAGSANYPQQWKPPTNREWHTSLGHSGWAEVMRHLRTLSTVSTAAARRAILAAPEIFQFWAADTGSTLERDVVLSGPGVIASIAADVKGFDHQVGIDAAAEFWSCVREVVPNLSWQRVASDRVPPYGELLITPDEHDTYIQTPLRAEYERAGDYVSLIRRTRARLIRNTGLLTSGTPETSKLGNRASYLVCSVCCDVLVAVWPGSVEMFDVRGDDQLAALRGRSKEHASELAKLWWLAASAFFELSPEKSKISIGEGRSTEFLRVEYSDAGARGYLNRSLVWFTEMRPLSNEPVRVWASKVTEMLPRVHTCIRRGCSQRLLSFTRFTITAALSRLGISYDYVCAPTGMGGLGLDEPACVTVKVRSDLTATTAMRSGWAADIVRAELAEFAPSVDESRAVAQARADTLALSSEDRDLRSRVYLSKPEFSYVALPEVVAISLPHFSDLVAALPAAQFGTRPELSSRFVKAVELARVRRVSAYSLLPVSEQKELRAIEKRYKFPRSIAVDWCAGVLPGNQSHMHPELSFISSRLAASAVHIVSRKRALWDAHSSYFAVAHIHYLVSLRLASDMSQLYSW